jgi:hypothetical protein
MRINMIKPIHTDHLVAEFDDETGVAFITYIGRHTQEAGDHAARWGRELVQQLGPQAIRGAVFDFSQVTTFEEPTFSWAKTRHENINRPADMTHHPIAMIVATQYQDSIVSAVTERLGTTQRAALVNNRDEALAFIDSWHAQLDDPDS